MKISFWEESLLGGTLRVEDTVKIQLTKTSCLIYITWSFDFVLNGSVYVNMKVLAFEMCDTY